MFLLTNPATPNYRARHRKYIKGTLNTRWTLYLWTGPAQAFGTTTNWIVVETHGRVVTGMHERVELAGLYRLLCQRCDANSVDDVELMIFD